jgi:dipeptidyl aminopeptidase/acylaminoacyl peptidase
VNAPTTFDRALSDWLEAEAPFGAPAGLHDSVIERAGMMRQRPRLVVAIRAGADLRRRDDGRRNRRPLLLIAAALLVGTGVIGAAVVGGHLITPKPEPTLLNVVPNPTILATPAPEASPSAPPAPALFVFNKGAGTAAECRDGRGGCISRLWVANLDGTGAHELLADQRGCQRFQDWSPDGTRLLFSRSDCRSTVDGMFGAERFYLTDASGSEPQLVDTGCVSPCLSEDDAVYSSDGRQILFVRTVSVPVPPSATPDPMGKPVPPTEKRVLASLDLSTGRVTELRDFDICDQCGTEWPRSYPAWSPDRTQIAYTWAAQLPGPQPPKDPAVFIADADGGNAHQVSAIGSLPGWSPDGTEIVFHGIQ